MQNENNRWQQPNTIITALSACATKKAPISLVQELFSAVGRKKKQIKRSIQEVDPTIQPIFL
jgi:hypothetical protein